jgi:hypothetical protein
MREQGIGVNERLQSSHRGDVGDDAAHYQTAAPRPVHVERSTGDLLNNNAQRFPVD